MRSATVTLALLLTLGCQTAAAPPFSFAVAPELTEADRRELNEVISSAVGLPSVRLGANAFATSHILALEPAMTNTPQGRIATGRLVTKPEIFHLLSDGKRCVVERIATQQRLPLSFACQQLP